MGILSKDIFQELSNSISLIANLCVLFMTAYTLYLTVCSKKISFVSMGCDYSMFYGDKLYIYVKNCSLHDIPICNVFLMKKSDNYYNRISIVDFKEPYILHFGHVSRIESKPFTDIMEYDDGFDNLLMNTLIGIDTGERIIWVKPYKKSPYFSAIRDYKKHNFGILTVSRNIIDGKVISKSINYIIRIIGVDENEKKKINTIFMICGVESGILSDPINGCNVIDKEYCKSSNTIKKYLCESLHIPDDLIDMKSVGGCLHNS